jgi:hypothetical protein
LQLILVEQKLHLIDQGPEHLGGLGPPIIVLKALVEGGNPLRPNG